MAGGIEKLIMMDMSPDMIKLCKDSERNMPDQNIETSFVIGDEEFLPVKERWKYCLLFFILYFLCHFPPSSQPHTQIIELVSFINISLQVFLVFRQKKKLNFLFKSYLLSLIL